MSSLQKDMLGTELRKNDGKKAGYLQLELAVETCVHENMVSGI